jgi:hypothetical protein
MKVDTTKIENALKTIEQSIANAPNTLKESREARYELYALLDDPKAIRTAKGRFDSLASASKLANDVDQAEKFRATLAADLMKVDTRYVVTDAESLTSPAGFHPSEKVYLQTQVAIHTDSLDALPASNVKLFVHEVNPQ